MRMLYLVYSPVPNYGGGHIKKKSKSKILGLEKNGRGRLEKTKLKKGKEMSKNCGLRHFFSNIILDCLNVAAKIPICTPWLKMASRNA